MAFPFQFSLVKFVSDSKIICYKVFVFICLFTIMSRNLTSKALEKQTAKFRKLYDIHCIMLKNQRLEGKNTKDPDETAHYEPSHLYIQYLQIQLLLCLTLYGLKNGAFIQHW